MSEALEQDFSSEVVTVYTDGGCIKNPGGPGGWAAVINKNGQTMELWGGEPETTNNRMEMMGPIMALKALKESCKVVIYTDSQYVQKGMTEWRHKWKRFGWKKTRNDAEQVKNADLWQELDALCADRNVTWKWVRGHSGIPGNERADQLATQAIKEIVGQENIDELRQESNAIDSDKFVTIFADASHCPDTKAFGWAGWVKFGIPAQTERFSGGGHSVANSGEAELIALRETIKQAVEKGIPFNQKIVVIQSDCIAALDKLRKQLPKLLPRARFTKLKHVKGHQGNKTPRNAVNTWCDKAAREEMQTRRQQRQIT